MTTMTLSHHRISHAVEVDLPLLGAAIALLAFGLVMVTSASLDVADVRNHQALYYFWRHGAYILIGLFVGFAMLRVPLRWWHEQSWVLLAIALAVLLAVLIPGIGRTVNGSTRWVGLGIINIQPSEIAKVCMVIYTASYLVRRMDEVRGSWWGFIKPLLVLMLVALLLLMEPDFGALVVIMSAIVGMIFLSGVALKHFGALLVMCVSSVALLAISQPYRLKRLTAYTDPWADQFNSGYQLTQSLIAFGRGELTGVGLGNSVQKLFYLPEAHTDFVFAIIGEELGLIGVLVVLALYGVLLWRGMSIARSAEKAGQLFNAYVGYGITLLLGVQALINLGVNTGLLPTKGLTLPLISYGGSSLIISCLCVGILLRIRAELGSASESEGGRS
ncbi:putative lipid II flippase FtsW [Hahella sp. CCB-MM4]|uniref:putative lipid II flippase FtsW n=1 Tax=Hahella sp. (strain CCB-MM4) TaxID=1926491 RepID=UPI000B9AC8DF|nr:putative lipid II flippase FtsW [Hahella sp. CCB-MM4]OZG72035.1 putative lipid II flippase FtsW [Hahella sp. CCB-MM4]